MKSSKIYNENGFRVKPVCRQGRFGITASKSKFIQASSLLETVIAITIISICVAIAISVYVNVMNSSASIAKMKAYSQMEALYRKTLVEQNYAPKYLKTSQYTIEKEVVPTEISTDLWRVEFILKVGKEEFYIDRYMRRQ